MAVQAATSRRQKPRYFKPQTYTWQTEFAKLYQDQKHSLFRFHLTRERTVEGYVLLYGMEVDEGPSMHKVFIGRSLKIELDSRQCRGLRFKEILRIERLDQV